MESPVVSSSTPFSFTKEGKFLEAVRAFDPGLLAVRPLSRLDTILLKPSAAPTVIDAFLNGTAPDASVITLEQPVVGL